MDMDNNALNSMYIKIERALYGSLENTSIQGNRWNKVIIKSNERKTRVKSEWKLITIYRFHKKEATTCYARLLKVIESIFDYALHI